MPAWESAPVVGGTQPRNAPVYGPPPTAQDRAEEERKRAAEARANASDRRAEESAAREREKFQRDLVKEEQGSEATESERTAAFLGTRLVGNAQQINDVLGRNSAAGSPTLGAEAVRGIFGDTVANYKTGADRQIVEAAQLDFIDAALTLGTGAAYTPEQLETYRKSYFPVLGDKPETIASKRNRLKILLEAGRVKAGAASPQIDQAISAIFGDADGKYYGGNAETENSLPTGESRIVDDPKMSKMLDGMIRAGVPLEQINRSLQSAGFTPIEEAQYIEWQNFLADTPGFEGTTATANREEPLSLFERGANAAGNFNVGGVNPAAYFMGAGQMLSGNTLDNISVNPEQARQAYQIMREQNPGSTFTGEVSGATLGVLAGEAGLARAGMSQGLARSTLADVAYGGAAGAGAADDGNRLGGAAGGAGSALAGGLIGRGVARAVAPSGGGLADLYEAGVRPTPGQRFVNSGVAGRALNATEEALQSVPLVGAAITGARQEARDQFQIGAFNSALKEIGEELPKGMKPGTAPHAFAQKKFDDIYDLARSGMQVVPDQQLANDIAALAPDIQALGPTAQNKLKGILANVIKDDLSGDTYKRVMSDLGKKIAQNRKGSMADDQALADVLDEVKGALDSAARRHSDPEAVKLLDAADAGYAKFVRIEEAGMKRSGDAGTFTPTQFDAAVQKTTGGVRSKAYQRGDALMQDYASQGKNLADRLPNSGTADRALTAGGLATAAGAYIEPSVAAILGILGLAYAPGARKITTGAFAPAGPTRKAISEQLKRLSPATAGTGAALALETAPSQ